MNASWMIYATSVGLLVAAATTIMERPLRDRAVATRIVWVVMLGGALAWPLAIAVLSRRVASVPLPQRYPPVNQVVASTASPVRFAPAVALPAVVPASPSVDFVARRVMILAPILVLAVLLLELIRLARARRRWQPGLIDGTPVLVSTDFGPAIVGVWRPQIVIPVWALELPADQRALMMAHESEHLDHRDSRWLGAAFMAVLIAPWNVGLWWLLRRFRIAMELDCDQRVLRRGYDVAAYGELLLEIGRRSGGRSLLAAGFAERRSMLRSRIDAMTAPASSTSGWRVAVGSAMLLGACVLGPSHDDSKHDATGASSDTGARILTDSLRNASIAVPQMPPRVQAMLKRFPPPANGLPTVATRFTRDTAKVGDEVEFVTVTWFPRRLRDSLRHMPYVTNPRFSGDSASRFESTTFTQTRNVRGQLYDMYSSWLRITTSRPGRIEARPATLSYQVQPPASFPEGLTAGEQRSVQSLATALVVRPE